MFYQFVSPLSKIIFTVFEYVKYLITYKNSVRIITINMGGREHNPFEYYFDSPNDAVFKEYKTILSQFSISDFSHILKTDERFSSYSLFIKFVSEIKEDTVFDYFFSEPAESKKKLKLDNKYGRTDGYRFNPVEHGYDPVFNSNFDGSQYDYVKYWAMQSADISDLYLKCIQTLDINDIDNMTLFYNLVLFDMMNICAVYHSHEKFDNIFVPKDDDTRITQITSSSLPAIIVTQEKPLPETESIRLIGRSTTKAGTQVYAYNIPENDLSVNSVKITPSCCNNFLGNEKGVIVSMVLYGKSISINALHCKDFTKVMPRGSLTDLVEFGINPLIKTGNNSHDMTIVLGDFNPSTNDISSEIKTQLLNQLNTEETFIYPSDTEPTTKKIRSGYCAQMSKFFKTDNTEISKDMIIFNGNTSQINEISSVVYPSIEQLLSKSWIGDHRYVGITLEFD